MSRPATHPADWERRSLDPVRLAVLTEEEVAAAWEAAAKGLVPLERVHSMGEHERTVSMATCKRSLKLRRLLDRNGHPTGRLQAVDAIRSMPSLIAIVDRVDGGSGTSSRYLYGGPAGLLLEEAVAEGVHDFVLCSASFAVERLVDYVDPDRRALDRDGEPTIRRGDDAPRSWDDVVAVVGRVETVTQLFSVRAGPPEEASITLSVVAGESGLVVVGGYGPSGEGSSTVVMTVSCRSISAMSLRAVLAAFLDPTPVVATNRQGRTHGGGMA